MNLRDHPKDDGKKVWLSGDALDQLVITVDDMKKRLAIHLYGCCDLSTKEVLDVTNQHIVDLDARHTLRILKGKGLKNPRDPDIRTARYEGRSRRL